MCPPHYPNLSAFLHFPFGNPKFDLEILESLSVLQIKILFVSYALCLSAWRASLNVISVSIHVAINGIVSFFFMAE